MQGPEIAHIEFEVPFPPYFGYGDSNVLPFTQSNLEIDCTWPSRYPFR